MSPPAHSTHHKTIVFRGASWPQGLLFTVSPYGEQHNVWNTVSARKCGVDELSTCEKMVVILRIMFTRYFDLTHGFLHVRIETSETWDTKVVSVPLRGNLGGWMYRPLEWNIGPQLCWAVKSTGFRCGAVNCLTSILSQKYHLALEQEVVMRFYRTSEPPREWGRGGQEKQRTFCFPPQNQKSKSKEEIISYKKFKAFSKRKKIIRTSSSSWFTAQALKLNKLVSNSLSLPALYRTSYWF